MKVYYRANKNELDKFILQNNRYAKLRSAYSINFMSTHDIQLITEFVSKFGLSELDKLYRKISINFDRVVNELGFYEVNNSILPPSALATSERNMLYVFLCKYLNKETFIIGLLEGLDYTHREILLEELRDSEDKIEVLILDKRESIGLEVLV